MSSLIKKHWVPLFFVAFILTLVIVSLFITPEDVVEYVGVENTYLVSFLLAAFGGLSTVTGAPFFVSVVAFSSGGANPILLGLFGGFGIFISDSIFFLAARYGVEVFKRTVKPLSLWLVSKISKFSLNSVLVGVYLYIGFTPLPNDILMVALAIAGMSYKRLAPVLLVGSITVVMLVAYLGHFFL